MSEPTSNVELVQEQPVPTVVVEKVPFWKNPKVLKVSAVVAASAAAGAYLARRFSNNETPSVETDTDSSDTTDIVID